MATVCITGANRGIGLELTKLYRERGADVVAACRSSSAELDRTGAEVVEGVDVASDAGVATLVGAIGDRSVDVGDQAAEVPDVLCGELRLLEGVGDAIVWQI